LRFRRRTLVPWNAAGAVVAALYVAMAVLGVLQSQNAPEKKTSDGQEQAAVEAGATANAELRIAALIVEQVVVVGATFYLIVVYFNPSREDVGLPANARELGSDVLYGIVAVAAAIAPVFVVMMILSGPEKQSEHPLIKMVSEVEPDQWLFLFFC